MTNAMPPTSAVGKAGVQAQMSRPRRWLALLPLAAVLIGTASHWLELFRLWNETSTLGHGWLLLGLIGYELWQRRASIREVRLTFDGPVLLGLLTLSLAWFGTLWLEIDSLALSFLPVLLLAAIGVATGRQGLRTLAFPVLLLLFATPLWTYLVPVLKAGAIAVVSFLVRAVGMTALIEGEVVILPSGVLRIADSCSGVHQFVVASLIGTVYAWWNASHYLARARIIALACVIAIITNWVRVFALVAIGYYSNMEHYLVRVDHYWFGWALFAIAMSVFFLIARRFADRAAPDDDSPRE